MWWQDQSPSLNSSNKSRENSGANVTGSDVTPSTFSLQDSPGTGSPTAAAMIVPTSEEFRKLPAERQTEELFILIQRLLPLTKRTDSLTDTVSALAERVNSIEAQNNIKNRLSSLENEDATAQDSDSLYKSLTSIGGNGADSSMNKPDPFVIKRSKEINQ